MKFFGRLTRAQSFAASAGGTFQNLFSLFQKHGAFRGVMEAVPQRLVVLKPVSAAVCDRRKNEEKFCDGS
jgi:hypothetical protein